VVNKVCIFWDNSNIFIPAKTVAGSREGMFAQSAIRIHFNNLFDLAKAARPVVSGVCVGSVPPELQRVWGRLRETGVTVELYERGKESGKEQGVDQCLQVHMLRALADVQPPQVAVVLTGDGAGYEEGTGYHADMERLAKAGWGVEVLSWEISCNRKMKEWAKTNGVFVPLEKFYDSITFLEDTRLAQLLNLTRRACKAAREVETETC